jgi:hypothetical protein
MQSDELWEMNRQLNKELDDCKKQAAIRQETIVEQRQEIERLHEF